MAAEEEHEGGYEASFFEKVDDRYICNICTKPLCDPRLFVCCGKNYCDWCVRKWFQNHHTRSCPHCRATRAQEEQNILHVPNKGLKQEVLALKVRCDNHQDGCDWVGELGSRNNHLISPNDGCGYVYVECPNKCYRINWKTTTHVITELKRKDVQNHINKDCIYRQYQCEHCGTKNKYVQITGDGTNFTFRQGYHYLKCREIEIDCPNKCDKKIKRKNIEKHRTKCPNEIIPCPNKCEHVFKEKKEAMQIQRNKLNEHLSQSCYLRPYKCEYCSYESTYEEITGNGLLKSDISHYDFCQEYPLVCPNSCGMKSIQRKKMKLHLSHCPEHKVQCPNKCSVESIKQKDLNNHITDECQLRQYTCEHCKTSHVFAAIKEHYTSCPKYLLDCPNKCSDIKIAREDMPSHCNECPLQPVDCPFSDAGCSAKFVRRDLQQHTTTVQQQHLALMMIAFKKMKEEHKRELQKTNAELRETEVELLETKKNHQVEVNKVKQELHQTKQELLQTRDELKKARGKLEAKNMSSMSTNVSQKYFGGITPFLL